MWVNLIIKESWKHCEQLPFLPQFYQIPSAAETSESVCMGKKGFVYLPRFIHLKLFYYLFRLFLVCFFCFFSRLFTFGNLMAQTHFIPFIQIDAFWLLCSRQHFLKHGDKRRNCSKQAISTFVTMFSTLFNYCSFI